MDAANDQTIYALLPISLLGAVLNWSIFYAIHSMSSFEHAFGFLSANQALSDALHSTTFLLYFCPMVLLDHPLLKQYSYHCGFVLLFCYELSVFTHFVISLNRFCAVWTPYTYEHTFSNTKTKIIILFLWVFVGTMALVFYQKFCWFYYDEKIHFLTFSPTEFCGVIGWYGDFLKNSTVVAVVMCTDLLTLFKVRQITKRVSTCITADAQHKISNREMRFLKQTVFQGSVFMLELLTYFFIPQYFTDPWIVFFGTSFAWVAVHAADGMVVLACNPEVRRFLFCQKQPHQSTHTNTNAANSHISHHSHSNSHF